MIVNKLLETLKVAEVKIDFRSLVSERNITAPCTLREDIIPNHFNIKQNPDGDKIIVWRQDVQKWEDIEVSSIISWSVIDGTQIGMGL